MHAQFIAKHEATNVAAETRSRFGARALLTALARFLNERAAHRRSRRELEILAIQPDYLLDDVGLSRFQVRSEAVSLKQGDVRKWL